MLILRQNDASIKFKVFRKPTHGGKYLDFRSNNPVTHKKSVISTLFKRSKEICDAENKIQEDNEIRKQLKENNYPANIINKVYKKINNSIPQDRNPPNPSTKFVSAPYIRNASERIARALKPHGIIMAHKPSHTLKSILSNPKDRIKNIERCDVVYKLPCDNCDMCYIGETSKQVKVIELKNTERTSHNIINLYSSTNILLRNTKT